MVQQKMSEKLGYFRLFSECINSTKILEYLYSYKIKKTNILEIKKDIKLMEMYNMEEAYIRKAFDEFLTYAHSNKNSNNHYFMNAMIRDFKEDYWSICFSGCYTMFLQEHKNNLTEINKWFLNNNIEEYIEKYIKLYSKEDWNEIPKTTFIANYTEKMLKTSIIERNFLSVSRSKSNYLNVSLKEKKYILRYAALSIIRNPKVIENGFKYFYVYFKNLNKTMELYDYLCMKFTWHIMSCNLFFKTIKNLKKNYHFKVITSNEKLICSDSQLTILTDRNKNDEIIQYYCLLLNANSFIYFYPKKEENYVNTLSNELIIKIYERYNLIEGNELIFIPKAYDEKLIKKILKHYNKEFKFNFINSINPYNKWEMSELTNIEEYQKRKDKMINETIVCDKNWKNGYFLKEIKRISEGFDKG